MYSMNTLLVPSSTVGTVVGVLAGEGLGVAVLVGVSLAEAVGVGAETIAGATVDEGARVPESRD